MSIQQAPGGARPMDIGIRNTAKGPIAIFGAGILGTCTALELAERGHHVALFERNAEPFSEASLFNEGKLHMGFVYAADPTFRTAERMIRGGAHFLNFMRRWVPGAALHVLPARSFDYVVHRDTMVTIPQIEAHFTRVAKTLGEVFAQRSPLDPLDASRPFWRRLTGQELSSRYDPALVAAAYETSEIAVDVWELAKHLRAALRSHPRIELITNARVITARNRADGGHEVVYETQGRESVMSVAAVVNASWTNRPAIDGRYGLTSRNACLIRRKLGVNLQCGRQPADLPSLTIVLGPFGDVVAYHGGRVYLSWYPVCMVGTGNGAEETDWNAELAKVDKEAIRRQTIDALARICPAVGKLEATASPEVVVNGGSIFALGKTDIDDPASQLHERLDMGFGGRGNYLSVDTAKFSLGPAMALQTADRITALVGAPA